MRAELRQVGKLESGFGSLLRYPLMALCIDKLTAIVCACDRESEFVLITSRYQSRDVQSASSVVREPVDSRVADPELAKQSHSPLRMFGILVHGLIGKRIKASTAVVADRLAVRTHLD